MEATDCSYKVEVISRLATWSRDFERQYLQRTNSEIQSILDEALVRLYANILAYLARMVEIFKKKEIGKADGLILIIFTDCTDCVHVR